MSNDRGRDRGTDGETFAILKLLSELKMSNTKIRVKNQEKFSKYPILYWTAVLLFAYP